VSSRPDIGHFRVISHNQFKIGTLADRRLARTDRTVARLIGRILLPLATLAGASVLTFVLVAHLWDRYEAETAALGFSGIYERYLAFQAGSSDKAKARVTVEAERVRHEAAAEHQLAPVRAFRQSEAAVRGALGETNQGIAVALSADGNTAIVGGPGPNDADRDRSPAAGPAGAAWVFMRSGGPWTQQGDKLVGTTSEHGGGLWSQGASVALSADGNTAIVGGPSDNKTTGAAWVFARRGSAWTQQGNKLVGTDTNRPSESPPLGQGMSVALSADGNTAIVGGWRAEAAWVFTRSGEAWTQQGKKLVGNGAVGSARQGMSVALSADGSTAIVGGWSDNGRIGAAWVFTRSGERWTQQGKKLVGTEAIGRANQGVSVALSADGNTALVGGPGDNPWDQAAPFGLGAVGAAWVFTRSGGVWTQQGNKLVGAVGAARQGMSVALSADGNIAVVGGVAGDGAGVASVFTRSEDHWTLDEKLVGTGAVGKSAPSVALSADGNIVMIGGSNDNGGVGAAWVFTRRGGHWMQDKKLVGTGGDGRSATSVAPSTDDNTGTIGGSSPNDNGRAGAASVFMGGAIADHPERSTPPAPSDPALSLDE
jgi:hypothetical protein